MMQAATASEELVLTGGWRRRALLFVLSIAFVIAGVSIPTHDFVEKIVLFTATGFFGLCTLAIGSQLLPGANELRLGRDGFTVRTGFRTMTYRWNDVSSFTVKHVAMTPMVAITFTPSYRPQAAIRTFSRLLTGMEGGLPETYGRSYEELAALLESYRQAAPGTR